MPSTIRDLNELAAPATNDYLIVSDTSDVVDRDKKLLVGKFPLKNGTPVAGRVTSWTDANQVQDAGYATTDVAKITGSNTFTGTQFATSFGCLQGASLASGTAISIVAASGLFIIALSNRAQSGGIFAFRTAATIYCTTLVAGTDLNVVNGVLNGSTGAAGKLNVGVHTDGRIYIENQLGTTQSVRLLIIA